ncbi:Cysteine-rich secretory protein family protein [Nocardia amikacinitolerans]|uniref:CAP domain-containing protein n=1 Tax=Nocardia amikacinitolerans TaxID=756689 RepID=UPI000833ABEA|nr:CAP domain-containing protein [Nocardia amikacinitolerans]MCP2315121.1 Cysteine-rich secretory protein family protein [Nocardia amikacinitolerans]
MSSKSCAVVALIAAATVGGSAVNAVPAQSDTWSNQVLAEHDAARAKFGAPPLSWSTDTYSAAMEYAQRCEFRHSDAQGNYGENLYVSTDLNAGIEDAVAAWMAESSMYDYNRPNFSAATGHFTQVVWMSTKQVGAAAVVCAAGTILPQPTMFIVARYTPAGNVLGQFPENVGRPR